MMLLTKADDFLKKWASNYPDCAPIGYQFKWRMAKRWARIHSLPLGKRYPENDDERRELLRRQNTLIDDLIGASTAIQIVTNWMEPDNHLFHSENLVDLGIISLGEGEPEFQCYFWDDIWETGLFDVLLAMIADEQMRAFIIGPDCLIAPYDGGVDVILQDAHTAWAFKRRYQDWLPARADGL